MRENFAFLFGTKIPMPSTNTAKIGASIAATLGALEIKEHLFGGRYERRLTNRQMLYELDCPAVFYREGRRLNVSHMDLIQDLQEWGRTHRGINYSDKKSFTIIEKKSGSFLTGNRRTHVEIRKNKKVRVGKFLRIRKTKSEVGFNDQRDQTVSQATTQPTLETALYQPNTNLFHHASMEVISNSSDFTEPFIFYPRREFIEIQELNAEFTYDNNCLELANTDMGLILLLAFLYTLIIWAFNFLWEKKGQPSQVQEAIKSYEKGEMSLDRTAMFLFSNFGYSWSKSLSILEPGKEPEKPPIDTVALSGKDYGLAKQPIIKRQINSFAAFSSNSALSQLPVLIAFFALVFFSFCVFADFGLTGLIFESLFVFLVKSCWRWHHNRVKKKVNLFLTPKTRGR